jgi:hypothetical protein
VPSDRSFVVTGDRVELGEGAQEPAADAVPMVAAWDSRTGKAVFRVLRPHPLGVVALDVTPDGTLIATLSAPERSKRQTIAIWKKGPLQSTQQDTKGSGPSVAPMVTVESPIDAELSVVRFNTADVSQLVVTGQKGVLFL